MTGTSRRTVLRTIATGGLSVALAGCSSEIESTPESDEPPRWDEDSIITDFEASIHRVPIEYEPDPDRQIVSYREDANDDTAGSRRRDLPYLIDDADLEALHVDPEPDDVDTFWAFLENTDFEAESIVINQQAVSECHTWALQYVEIRSNERLAPQFCQVKRDPSIPCSNETRETQITLIRVPMAFESRPRGHGSGRSSGCRLPPDHPAHSGGAH